MVAQLSEPSTLHLDVTSLLAAYRDGALTPVEVAADSLEQLQTEGRRLNAVVTVADADAVNTAAAESTARWRAGTPRPLEGIPFGVKDIMSTAGLLTTGGSKIFGSFVPDDDAAVVARLTAAGAILVAKFQTFAFANGDPVNQDFGPTVNPCDETRIAGGSSSGSAAAVAAGLVSFALGSDTGGSIRLPAAYCGIAGLKPTYGRVSRYGVMPLAWTLDHVGPMTRSARDLRAILAVLSGHDSRDPATHARSSEGLDGRTPERVLRVGVPTDYFLQRCDEVTLRRFDSAVALLGQMGMEVVPVTIEHLDLAQAIGRTIISAEASSLHAALREHNADYDDMLGGRLLAAELITARDYLHSLRLRHVLQLAFERAMEHVDVLVTPTTPTVAPPLETLQVATADGENVGWLEVAARNTFPTNITGMPAVTVPIPGEGLPVGLQIAARPQDDAMVLDLAEAFEERAAVKAD